jgi:hypothetical protein
MLNIAFRLLLTVNATSLLLIVYLVQNKHTLSYFFNGICWLQKLPNFFSYILYSLITLLLTWISIHLSCKLGKDTFNKGEVDCIEHANNSFLPSYLGYFFVALGINNWETLWFVYIVLFVFTFLSQALYFNPLFLAFGYEFYNIKTKTGAAIFLISRHKYKKPDDIDIPVAYRINNYTFIER